PIFDHYIRTSNPIRLEAFSHRFTNYLTVQRLLASTLLLVERQEELLFCCADKIEGMSSRWRSCANFWGIGQPQLFLLHGIAVVCDCRHLSRTRLVISSEYFLMQRLT